MKKTSFWPENRPVFEHLRDVKIVASFPTFAFLSANWMRQSVRGSLCPGGEEEHITIQGVAPSENPCIVEFLRHLSAVSELAAMSGMVRPCLEACK